MKRIFIAFILCGMSIQARNAGGRPEQRVTVYVDDKAKLPADVAWRATAIASEIFENIGIHIQWKAGKLPRTNTEIGECAHADERTIPVTIHPFALGNDSGGWAYANLRTGAINVYYDRIRSALMNSPRRVQIGMGFTLAHEVAHVLQVIGRHADSGILKAKWTQEDFHEMETGTLEFTPADIRLIQYGMVSQSCTVSPEVASQ
jgi:hypothetical protein